VGHWEGRPIVSGPIRVLLAGGGVSRLWAVAIAAVTSSSLAVGDRARTRGPQRVGQSTAAWRAWWMAVGTDGRLRARLAPSTGQSTSVGGFWSSTRKVSAAALRDRGLGPGLEQETCSLHLARAKAAREASKASCSPPTRMAAARAVAVVAPHNSCNVFLAEGTSSSSAYRSSAASGTRSSLNDLARRRAACISRARVAAGARVAGGGVLWTRAGAW
jgi:hypothetical protein